MLSFAQPQVAWVRPVSPRYVHCIRPSIDEPIDLNKARAQHAGYARALQSLDIEVRTLPTLDDAPDGVFVEDAALVFDKGAIITRPGHETRRREGDSLVEILGAGMELETMQAPATLDGGDVLRVGSRFFVGVSGRTNREGVEFVERALQPWGLQVVAVPVNQGLHLKSACSLLDEGTLLYLPDRLDPEPFKAFQLECITAPEVAGANVLACGSSVLVSEEAPRTAELIAERGLGPIPVDIGEFHKGDGALSCLSLRAAKAMRWCV